MDEQFKAFLESKGEYVKALGGYQSKDNSDNKYEVFYGIRNKIGTGGFGIVYHADRFVAKADGIRRDPRWSECAVKELKPPPDGSGKMEEFTERIRRELEFNNNDHLHTKKHLVIPIRVHLLKNELPLIVMEYCGGGDLARFWLNNNQRLGERLSRKVVSHVVEGLKELLDVGYFHRDVKPANIFISGSSKDVDSFVFKLGDFGLVARVNEVHRILCGTPANLAPEITGRNVYGPEVDVWSLGVLLYTILVGQVPFRGTNDNETIRKSRSELHHFPENIYLSNDAKDLIDKMLQKDPKQRIGLSDICNHSFFKEAGTTKLAGPSLQKSSVSSNDSGFSSSNASVGGSGGHKTHIIRTGTLPALQETDIERHHDKYMFSRQNFPRPCYGGPSTISGPVVASLRFDQDMFQQSHSCERSLENPNFYCSDKRYASSAPSLASNLSSGFIGLQTYTSQGTAPRQITTTITLSKPLSTARLRPSTKKHNFKIGSGLIQADGSVRLEFEIPKRPNKNVPVTETIIVSPDGMKIEVFRSNVPEFGTRRWSYEELPTKYWSKYNYAAKFVTLVRESTPKITVYTDEAVFKLMENGPPEANFEIQFYNGVKYIFSSSKGLWLSSGQEANCQIDQTELKRFELERERVKNLEKMMEELEKEEQSKVFQGKRYTKFPLVMGRRPASMSSLPASSISVAKRC